MPVPVSQMWTVATYVLKQKLQGRKRYPLVLMLEPLFRCNLACAGCGKIQYPAHVLKMNLSPEDCFRAVDECGAPMVSIPGGEPLMHPQIAGIVDGLVARKKYIYLCTNALLLKEKLDLFTPSKYLTFSVHVDGQREHHDFSVCREGGYDVAIEGVKEALKRGFRVTTNTTLFDGADPNSVRAFFDEMMDLGVEGMMLSPGYSYDKAPDQKHFLGRARTRRLFNSILANRKSTWRFKHAAIDRPSAGFGLAPDDFIFHAFAEFRIEGSVGAIGIDIGNGGIVRFADSIPKPDKGGRIGIRGGCGMRQGQHGENR